MAILSSMQIPDATVAQLDALARRLSKRTPGVKISRVEVIRMLLEQAVVRADELLAPKTQPSEQQLKAWGEFLELARASKRRLGPKHHPWTRADAYDEDDDEA